MKALVLNRILSPLASPIRPPAVAATDRGLLAPELAGGTGRREARYAATPRRTGNYRPAHLRTGVQAHGCVVVAVPEVTARQRSRRRCARKRVRPLLGPCYPRMRAPSARRTSRIPPEFTGGKRTQQFKKKGKLRRAATPASLVPDFLTLLPRNSVASLAFRGWRASHRSPYLRPVRRTASIASQKSQPHSCCAGQQVVDGLAGGKLVLVGGLLAADAVGRPWNSFQTLGLDRFFAVQANAIAAVRRTGKGSPHVAQQAGLAVQVANRQFPVSGKLHLIQDIRGLFDQDLVAIAQPTGQFGLLDQQDRLVFFEFGSVHDQSPICFVPSCRVRLPDRGSPTFCLDFRSCHPGVSIIYPTANAGAVYLIFRPQRLRLLRLSSSAAPKTPGNDSCHMIYPDSFPSPP